MQAGQVVRLRPGGRISSSRAIPPDASGVVVCAYEILAGGQGGARRIDVNFHQHGMVWGQPAEAFEATAQEPETSAR